MPTPGKPIPPTPVQRPAVQKILWTCLPNGIDESSNFLKLSVLVSPQLDPGSKAPRLDTFPDFSPWPAIFRNALKFSVQILSLRKITNVPTTSVKRIPPDPAGASPDPDPALWTKLFPPSTFVPSHGPNHAQRFAGALQSQSGFRSYPVRNIVAYMKSVQTGVASTSPQQALTPQHPVIADMVKTLGAVAANQGGIHNTLRAAIAGPIRVGAQTTPAALKLPASVSKTSLDFFQMHSFHKRAKSSGTSKRLAMAAAEPGQPPLDFHQMVAALADHPKILRLIGLIIDLEIPRAGLPTDGQMRLVPEWTPARPGQDLAPWTLYTIDKDFSAKPAAVGQPGFANLDHGYISLDGTNDLHDVEAGGPFEIVQIDPDGAGIKYYNFAGMLHSRPSGQSGNDVNSLNDASLPTLRSAGLSVIGVDRAATVESAIQQAAGWNDDPTKPNMPVFHADDLLRGYRVDILDESAPAKVWRSLCERIGTYQFKDGSSITFLPDEGYVKAASTTSDDANNQYLHEALFRWTGWSLCARRPGKTIIDQDAASVSNQAPEGIGLSVTFRPRPGSLPRLRYGHSYRVRMRAVDLAGNSLKLDPTPPPPPDPSHPLTRFPFSDSVVFTRFEQIDPPVVVQRDVLTEGESAERMVIRSNFNQSAHDYSQGKTYKAVNERHLAPPKTSQLMAELYGMFDKSVGSDKSAADHDAGYLIARREAGTFADTEIIDVTTGNTHDVPTVQQIPNAAGGGGAYFIHTEEQLLTPYLPDCIARGAALSGVPGVSAGKLADDVSAESFGSGGLLVKVPFAGSWPDNKPFRIRIQERAPGTMSTADPKQPCTEKFSDTGQPQWDPVGRVLTVFLAKGQVSTLTYSCYPDIKDVMVNGVVFEGVPLLGWLKWSMEALAEAWAPKWQRGGDNGDVVPRRKPVVQPSQMKLVQAWVDAAVNGSASSSPARQLVLVHAVQQPLCAPTFYNLTPSATLGATSVPIAGEIGFSECSTSKLDVLADWTEWVDNLAEPKPRQIHGHAHVAELLGSQPFQHKFGDTKYRSVNYHLVATTKFREYFPAAITQDPKNITREGPAFNVKIPNRARPAAPKVLYVLPTFEWQGVHDPTLQPKPLTAGSTVLSRRLSGGIRVYLDRPWFSSGDGELLGVVVWPYDPPIHDRFKNLVSQWGIDPVFALDLNTLRTMPTPAPANPDNFKGVALTAAGKAQTDYFQPPELPFDWLEKQGTPTILVIGYPVHYDEQRRLWYADIQFNAGNCYCPFIRLALARYQPNTIKDDETCVSPIVMADFAQLLPDRTTNIHVSNDMKSLTVQVSGPEPVETYVSSVKGNLTEISVEMRNPNNIDPDLGWAPAPNIKVTGSKSLVGWTGTVTMPAPFVAGKYRVVVKEFESHYQDGAGPDGQVVGSRLVYADAINL